MMHTKKTREPGKIHHMRDVRWKGLGAVLAYAWDFYWKKCDGKTVGLSKLVSPGADMLAWVKTYQPFACCVHATPKSLPP